VTELLIQLRRVRAKAWGHDASNNGDSKLIEALSSDELD